MKRRLFVIGIGAGNPEFVTIQAINAMNQVSVFFIPNKEIGKEGLARIRREICERYIENSDYRFVEFDMPKRARPKDNYSLGIEDWRNEVELLYERLLANEIGQNETAAFLVWGDPSLYDSTLRILSNINQKGEFALDYDVIPGISSVQALAARHKTALNQIGQPVTITTGRRLAEGFPNNLEQITVMLDADNSFSSLDGDIEIKWGAYVGTKDEILVEGKLREVCGEIERLRELARERYGWIMDSYILTKPSKNQDS